MLQASPTGIVALVAVVLSWSFAVVLFRAGERGSVARRLALLLFVEGLALASSGTVDLLFNRIGDIYQRHPALPLGEIMLHALGDCGMLVLYPPFLAAALRTPLTRILGSTRLRIAIACAAGVLYVALVTPFVMAFLHSAKPEYRLVALPAIILYVAMVLLFVFAFAASVNAWHVSSGLARKRARIFAFAFGFRDICWGFVFGAMVWNLLIGDYADVFEAPGYFVYVFATFIAVPLIAYGVLRTQLFDIDLRIRWTIKQSTLAAAVVAIVYLVSEGASRYLSSELGNVAGLFAAAVVVFFLAPLQRFAERVASVAMPNTHNTPEYAAFRKMQVYEAAVAEALSGGLSEKERALLRRLQESLGISADDAAAIENELVRNRT